MGDILRIGVIGYGYWGPNLVRNFVALPECAVTVVADLREENLAKVRAFYPTIRTVTSAEVLIGDPEVDAVAIATPVSTHFALAKTALEAGKHVLIEKPMTQTASQAEELIRIARAKGLTLMVDHTFVYTGAVRKIRSLLDSGELGNLFYLDSARINLGLIQKDANVLWDLAPHDLSIIAYLIDEQPEAVQAAGYHHAGSQQEELAFLNLRYPSGFHAHVRVSWLSPLKIRTMVLAGSKKMVVYDDVEPSEKVRVYDSGVSMDTVEVTALTPKYRAGDVLIPALDRTEALLTEARHFAQCIRSGSVPLTGGEAGLSVVRMLEASDRSLRNNSAFVPLAA